MNHVDGAVHSQTYPTRGDFLVDGRHLFGLGGKRKSFARIKDIPGSYVADDDLEVGLDNMIPLCLFGFLY